MLVPGAALKASRVPPSRSAAADRWTPAEVEVAFKRWCEAHPERARVFEAEAFAYVEYHGVRYARLLTAVGALLASRGEDPARDDPAHVLDIGPGVQTLLFRDAHPTDVFDTVGFAHPAADPREGERHIPFDLNDADRPDRVPALEPRYDVIVLAEVVEHLHTSLATVLRCVASWLAPGGRLIIQTPNGAALHKRLRLLIGRSPVEPPRPARENPGHFHEYTLAELRAEIAAAGLVLEWLTVDNHYGGEGTGHRLYRSLGTVLPPTFRHGVTACVGAAD